LEEKAELAKQSAKAEEVAEENEGVNDDMVTFIQQKFPGADANSKTRIKALMSEYGIENFKNASELNTDGLRAIVAVLNE
jgi:polyhydroxyalkanoate synthesis regulator phasin